MPIDFNKLSEATAGVQEIANELDALVEADSEDLSNLIRTQINSLAEATEVLNATFEAGEFDEIELQPSVKEV